MMLYDRQYCPYENRVNFKHFFFYRKYKKKKIIIINKLTGFTNGRLCVVNFLC